MTTEFESKGIKIYKDCLVAQWNDGIDCTEIKWVTFTSNDQPLKLECSVSILLMKRIHEIIISI